MHTLVKSSFALLGAALMLLLFTGVPAMAQDGAQLYQSKGCVTCHGPKGDKPIMGAYPKLAGQNSEYLVAQLKAFKSQQRKSGQASLMWGMAAQLSEQEMKTISDWLSKQ